LLLSVASAYNTESHLILTRIAYDILAEESPKSLSAAEKLLEAYSDRITDEKEGTHKFVEACSWADDIKYRGGGW
jgi:hypothetical protein